MLIYEDNHSLSSDPVEMDSVINGVLWLMEHNSTFIPLEQEVTVVITAPEEEVTQEIVAEAPVEKQEEKEEKKPEKKEKKSEKKK